MLAISIYKCLHCIQRRIASRREAKYCAGSCVGPEKIGKTLPAHHHHRHVNRRVGTLAAGTLVLPEAPIVGHCNTKVLLDRHRRRLALETVLRPVLFLTLHVAIINFQAQIALGACRSSTYQALAIGLTSFAHLTLDVLDCLWRRRTRPNFIVSHLSWNSHASSKIRVANSNPAGVPARIGGTMTLMSCVTLSMTTADVVAESRPG